MATHPILVDIPELRVDRLLDLGIVARTRRWSTDVANRADAVRRPGSEHRCCGEGKGQADHCSDERNPRAHSIPPRLWIYPSQLLGIVQRSRARRQDSTELPWITVEAT